MKLKTTSAVLALLALSLQQLPLMAQEVGLQLYSLREQFKTDVPGTLRTINNWGITHLEGGSTYGLSDGNFKRLLQENNLRIISWGASYDELQTAPEAILEKAKSYGASYVMCSWIPHKNDTFTIVEMEAAIEVFNRAGKLMEAGGITLVYHPHGYEFRPYDEGSLFDFMVRHSDHFDFEMDTYWVKQAGEDPLALLKKYADQFVLMHLKDRAHGTVGNPNGRGDVETNVVLGTGDVEVRDLLLEAKKMGMKYLFIEDESSRVEEQVPKSLRFAWEVLGN